MNGGYSNGYGDHASGRYNYSANGSHSRDRRDDFRSQERPRGYGGLGEQREHSRNGISRGTELERSRAKRHSGENKWSRSRSRSRGATRRAEQQITDVLEYIKQEWNFMTEDECIPVQTALQLLDSSSLGLARRYDEFHDTQQQLQNALRGIVNEHHQGFNSSIATFHQIQASIQSSHQRIRTLKDSLVNAKSNLTSTKAEFTALVDSSHNYESMVEVLSTIEQIQRIPEQLEARISEKRFLTAVESLQEGLRLIRGSELESIGALSDMKIYISNQEHSLADILIEELHNHLYLKSPYCENRCASYAKVHGRHEDLNNVDTGPRELFNFLDALNTSEVLVEDTSRNPEADSFNYIHVLVESLNKLGRLEDVVEAIEQRLPVELFKVVDRSNTEVQQRHPNSGRNKWRLPDSYLNIDFDDEESRKILNDLLATLYAKFEAVAESYRAFHEVITGISRREGGYDTQRFTRSFRELWKLYQSEIRSLLHDYLSPDGSSAHRLGQLTGEENVFKQQRDRTKKATFKLDLVDGTDPDVKSERDEVINLWQRFVPGLASLASESQENSSGAGNRQHDNSATGHKLLVEPNVFNISSLLPSSVLFLNRLKDLVPPNSDVVISTLSSFLNDFLINVFHPQLEDTLNEFCSESFVQLDAFQQDPQWAHHAKKPIFKGTIRFYQIITRFCKMLSDLTHDQLFSQIVIEQMNMYYDRCFSWYRALVTRAQAKSDGRILKAAACFSEDEHICDITSKIWDKREEGDVQFLIDQETAYLISASKEHPLDESDLLSDKKTQVSLCLLYTSMRWLSAKLSQLRFVSPRAIDTTGMEDSEDKPQLKRSLTTALSSSDKGGQEENPAYLPLSEGTASLFDGVIDGLSDLAGTALRTLHLELRCHIMQSLNSSFKGSLVYADPAELPDENVMKLVTDTLDINQELKNYLQSPEFTFITTGASQTVDAMLVRSTLQNVTAINEEGSEHMQLNARVLYHNMLNIESNADLPRSFAFFNLFEKGPDHIIAAANGPYGDSIVNLNREDYRTLLKLWYSEARESSNREEVMRANKSLDDRLAQLSEAT